MHLEASLNYFFTTFIKRFWFILLHITKILCVWPSMHIQQVYAQKNIFFQEYNTWCMVRSFLVWILRWQSLTDIKIDTFLITISNWHFYMLILHEDGNEKMITIWKFTSLIKGIRNNLKICERKVKNNEFSLTWVISGIF